MRVAFQCVSGWILVLGLIVLGGDSTAIRGQETKQPQKKASEQKKDHEKMIVGKWELVKLPDGSAPDAKIFVEFTKDNKMIRMVPLKGGMRKDVVGYSLSQLPEKKIVLRTHENNKVDSQNAKAADSQNTKAGEIISFSSDGNRLISINRNDQKIEFKRIK